jgi:ribosomal protein S18 acetylase RimI-like enzyme
MEPTFRLAGEADGDTLIAMMREFYAIDAYPFDEGAARRALEGLVRDTALGRVWLILDGADTIGYVVLTFGYSLEFHGRDAFVDELFVRPSYRRRGAGTRAMQLVVEACRDLGVQAVHLEVERANMAAQQLYRTFGFQDHARYLLTRWITR